MIANQGHDDIVIITHPHTWIASEMAEAVHGTLLSGKPDHVFTGISTDSRTITQGDCFLAITGDVHDGHVFVAEVLDKNVKGLIVDIDRSDGLPWKVIAAREIVSIGVADTLVALGALASWHRKKFPVSVVAVTGSNGKTSTRSMAAAVLAKRFQVLSDFFLNKRWHLFFPFLQNLY